MTSRLAARDGRLHRLGDPRGGPRDADRAVAALGDPGAVLLGGHGVVSVGLTYGRR